MSTGTAIVLHELHSTVTEMVNNGSLMRRPSLNPRTMAILSVSMHLGFIDAVSTGTSTMLRQPTVGMATIAMMALCTDGYEINHRTVVGVSREAMGKLWDIIASTSSRFIDRRYREYVLLGRSSSHYMQLFRNMPTPISMRTSRDDPARTDDRNEHMKTHYDGTLASTISDVDWDNAVWDFSSGVEVYSCIEAMDRSSVVMVEQATRLRQSEWQLPDDHA